jgi:hypothetical protein
MLTSGLSATLRSVSSVGSKRCAKPLLILALLKLQPLYIKHTLPPRRLAQHLYSHGNTTAGGFQESFSKGVGKETKPSQMERQPVVEV